MWLHNLDYIWSLDLQLIQANIEENHFLFICTRLKKLEKMRRHGKNRCSLKFMGYFWLDFLCELMTGELEGIMNKYVVTVHLGGLGLRVGKAH